MACAGDDFRFLFVELRVEDRVWNLGAFEHAREGFGRLHRSGADEAWLSLCVCLFDFGDHRVELFTAGLKDLVVFV